jgi:hypothetical protein
MNKEALTQKNTLLKNAKANAKGIFFKRVFFSATQERNSIFFSPTLRCFNFFCQRTVRNRTDIASNINRFEQPLSELQTVVLRTNSKPAGNISSRCTTTHKS